MGKRRSKNNLWSTEIPAALDYVSCVLYENFHVEYIYSYLLEPNHSRSCKLALVAISDVLPQAGIGLPVYGAQFERSL